MMDFQDVLNLDNRRKWAGVLWRRGQLVFTCTDLAAYSDTLGTRGKSVTITRRLYTVSLYPDIWWIT